MIALGVMIDNLFQSREKIRAIEKELNELKREKSQMEKELLERLDKEGSKGAKSKFASVTISENVKPQVVDWEDFYKFIHKHEYFHLLDRRPNVAGCRELFETKGMIPGVVPYLDRRINMRNNPDA